MFRTLFAAALAAVTAANLVYQPEANTGAAMTAINEAVLKEMNLTNEQWTEINARVTSQAPQGDDMQKYTQYSQLFAA